MNQLTEWLHQQKGGKSIRQMAAELELSHAHLAKVFREEVPVTWAFAATVAEKMGLDYLEAFRLAGLIKEEEDDEPGNGTPSPREKVTTASVPQKAAVVTNGIVR